jgi:hypothetical protein
MTCMTTALNGSFWKWVPEEGCIDAYRKITRKGKEYAAISVDDRMTSRLMDRFRDAFRCKGLHCRKARLEDGGDELIPLCQSAGAPNRKIAISSASLDRRQLGSSVESSVPVFPTLLQGRPCQGLALMEADSALRANSTNQTNGLWDTLELL